MGTITLNVHRCRATSEHLGALSEAHTNRKILHIQNTQNSLINKVKTSEPEYCTVFGISYL